MDHGCHMRVSAKRMKDDPYARASMRRHATRVKQQRKCSPADLYRRRALVFSFSGRWPLSRVLRPNARGYDGCPTVPPMPPDGMSEIEIARIVKLLERAGWTLRRNSEGKLVPVRTI